MSARAKLIIILNGVSRKKKKFYQQILPDLEREFEVTVWETQSRDHAIQLGAEAAKQNPYGILAAGGDGTLNQVINGMMNAKGLTLPRVGIIPLGTGNDFARLAGVKPNVASILEKIKSGGLPTDLGLVQCQDEKGNGVTRYFINVASLGMGPAVVHKLFSSNRALGPTLTYFKAIIQTFFTHKPEAVNISTTNWQWSGKLRVLAMANGQSFGSALFIAPDAQPNDGLLNTFIAGNVPLFKFLLLLQQVKAKKKIKDDRVQYNLATKLQLTSPKTCWIETEGELAGVLPATIEVNPGGLKFFR